MSKCVEIQRAEDADVENKEGNIVFHVSCFSKVYQTLSGKKTDTFGRLKLKILFMLVIIRENIENS